LRLLESDIAVFIQLKDTALSRLLDQPAFDRSILGGNFSHLAIIFITFIIRFFITII